ncbi:minor tail protein [Gordonia phage Coeur]|uniref:Minor tail protein n=1 Tax=Gordonia phage Coeur TaxID=2571246 RepID=A0A4Y6EQP1_9CAUD|nr:virion structural protein [Gordonia phage Coeur]QDF17434.1 minor tail protein [Gordonia phage Coeur]
MPAITPVYNLPYPTGNDPVAKGAQNMEALARRIEDILTDLSVPPAPPSNPPPPVCKIVRTSAQPCASATDVTVTWQAAAWDSMPGGQPQWNSNGFICRRAGIYRIAAMWPWAGNNATGRRNMKVTLNSTAPATAILCDAMNATTWENVLSAADDVALNVGDVVRMIVAQDSGVSLNGGKGSNAATALTGAMSFTWIRDLP